MKLSHGHHDLLAGFIRLHILPHAAEQEIFGLWMIEELARHGYRLSPGTLYPMLLHAMEERGYLTSRVNGMVHRSASSIGSRISGRKAWRSPNRGYANSLAKRCRETRGRSPSMTQKPSGSHGSSSGGFPAARGHVVWWPVAHLGYFRAEFVERRRWLNERAYVDLVALSQFLPGPASSQTGFAIGLMRGGYLGGLAAWIGFTLPSALLLLLFGTARAASPPRRWAPACCRGLSWSPSPLSPRRYWAWRGACVRTASAP